MAAQAFASEAVLAGRFRIIRFLGRGGMGEVYEAADRLLGQTVAIKTMRPELALDGRIMARFTQEVRLARQVTHRNVCRIHDVFEHADGGRSCTFVAMEYLPGETLHQHLKQRGRLAPNEALPVISQIAAGLEAAHAAGVIHRDLKPANVILTAREGGETKAVITDFGLAHSTAPEGETATLTGAFAGTPDYMAPEQFQGGTPGKATDVFALGVVAYEMLSGARPFRGLSREKPPSLRASAPEIEPAWERAVLRCLRRAPSERFSSAMEFVAALEGKPVRSVQPRRWWAAMALLVAAVAAVAVWFAWRDRDAMPPPARRWFDQGVQALHDGCYHAGVRALTEAVRGGGSLLAHARLAEAWMELDDVDKAREEMLRALAPGPRLAHAERDYIEAIQSTLTQKYSAAIVKYREIVAESQAAAKPGVLVDLGRVLEKQAQPKEAAQAYTEAGRLARDYAAPHLRLALLHRRMQRWKEAEAELNVAEPLYLAASNTEGIAECAYARGFLAQSQGRTPQARDWLKKALDLSRAVGNFEQQIKTLLQLSVVSRLEGAMPEAARYADEAMALARQHGVQQLVARGLLQTGSGQLVRGDYAGAEERFQEALSVARRYNSRRLEAAALFSLAGLHNARGKPDTALEEIAPALAYYRETGFAKEACQSLVLLGRARRDKGEHAAALAAFQEQLALAEGAGDQPQIALGHESMGSILRAQERFPAALEAYERAYGVNATLAGAEVALGYNALQRGAVLWQLGRYQEAESMLDEAAKRDIRPLRLAVARERAEMELTRGRYPEARSIAAAALRDAGQLSPGVMAAWKRVQCLALARSGAAREGRKLCQEAVVSLAAANDALDLLGARATLGEVTLLGGDAAGALRLLDDVTAEFTSRVLLESGWRARALAAAAAARLGRPATEHARRALETYGKLNKTWGDGSFVSYNTRPDVQRIRQNAGRLAGSK